MCPFLRVLRATLGVFALCAVLLAASTDALASSELDAKATLKQSLDNVFATLNNPRYSDGANREELLDTIEEIVGHIFDYDEFSARTVGKKWHSFNPDQQKRFSKAFADLLRATYIERIKAYTGNGVTYLGERSSTKGDKVEVQTHLDYEGKSVPVDYRMLQKDHWVIYDVIIEGVSLVKNYRTQFHELMSDNNTDAEALIAIVQSRAAEVRKLNNKSE